MLHGSAPAGNNGLVKVVAALLAVATEVIVEVAAVCFAARAGDVPCPCTSKSNAKTVASTDAMHFSFAAASHIDWLLSLTVVVVFVAVMTETFIAYFY